MNKTAMIAAALLGCGVTIAAAGPPSKLVGFPAGERKWEQVAPGGPEVSFVIGSKESKTGPSAFFLKFKAGFDSGWHTHDTAYTGIVLSGTVVQTSRGQPTMKLGEGSCYLQPTTVHRTACAPGADCVEYVYEDGPFSFTPMDEAGKPLSAAATHHK
jgi:quercetin dioxygenase-like cupin family protein